MWNASYLSDPDADMHNLNKSITGGLYPKDEAGHLLPDASIEVLYRIRFAGSAKAAVDKLIVELQNLRAGFDVHGID